MCPLKFCMLLIMSNILMDPDNTNPFEGSRNSTISSKQVNCAVAPTAVLGLSCGFCSSRRHCQTLGHCNRSGGRVGAFVNHRQAFARAGPNYNLKPVTTTLKCRSLRFVLYLLCCWIAGGHRVPFQLLVHSGSVRRAYQLMSLHRMEQQ